MSSISISCFTPNPPPIRGLMMRIFLTGRPRRGATIRRTWNGTWVEVVISRRSSLSHLAIPLPLSDPLYGVEPDTSEDYGANLGAMATRGERGTLIVSIDSLARMSSNPFFDYVMQRVEEGISSAAKAKP